MSPRRGSRAINRAPGSEVPRSHEEGVTHHQAGRPRTGPQPHAAVAHCEGETGRVEGRTCRRATTAACTQLRVRKQHGTRRGRRRYPHKAGRPKKHWGHNRVAGALRQNSTQAASHSKEGLAASSRATVWSGGCWPPAVDSDGTRPHRGGGSIRCRNTSRHWPQPEAHPGE